MKKRRGAARGIVIADGCCRVVAKGVVLPSARPRPHPPAEAHTTVQKPTPSSFSGVRHCYHSAFIVTPSSSVGLSLTRQPARPRR